METAYILVVNGKPEGPYSMTGLKQRNIQPADFVKSPDMDDYKEAQEIPELRELLGFSKPHLLLQYFASFDQRLLASFIDWFIIAGIEVIIVSCFLLFIPEELRMGIALSLIAIIPLTKFIYHIVMESSPRQGTYGKQVLKIKVCDMQGERLNPTKATARNLAKIISVLTLFIGYLYSFFNPKQQCLHDVIAGTLVIKDRLI